MYEYESGNGVTAVLCLFSRHVLLFAVLSPHNSWADTSVASGWGYQRWNKKQGMFTQETEARNRQSNTNPVNCSENVTVTPVPTSWASLKRS